MSRSEILRLVKRYAEQLRALDIVAKPIQHVNVRLDPDNHVDRGLLLSHALWACDHIPE